MLTADTITDEQLQRLRDAGNFYAKVALERRLIVTERTRADARARCAEYLNGTVLP